MYHMFSVFLNCQPKRDSLSPENLNAPRLFLSLVFSYHYQLHNGVIYRISSSNKYHMYSTDISVIISIVMTT